MAAGKERRRRNRIGLLLMTCFSLLAGLATLSIGLTIRLLYPSYIGRIPHLMGITVLVVAVGSLATLGAFLGFIYLVSESSVIMYTFAVYHVLIMLAEASASAWIIIVRYQFYAWYNTTPTCLACTTVSYTVGFLLVSAAVIFLTALLAQGMGIFFIFRAPRLRQGKWNDTVDALVPSAFTPVAYSSPHNHLAPVPYHQYRAPQRYDHPSYNYYQCTAKVFIPKFSTIYEDNEQVTPFGNCLPVRYPYRNRQVETRHTFPPRPYFFQPNYYHRSAMPYPYAGVHGYGSQEMIQRPYWCLPRPRLM